MNNVYEKYYLPFKKLNESTKDLIERIDKSIIEERFNHITYRDIPPEMDNHFDIRRKK
jgi:hypothetical protein